jgi:hypothetical protein
LLVEDWKAATWLGNVLMECKNFETSGISNLWTIVRNFRNSIPEINVFHLIFKQDFRNFRQMESAQMSANHILQNFLSAEHFPKWIGNGP